MGEWRMKKSVIHVPEAAVLNACMEFLAAERIWHRRWNTGAIRDGNGRPVRFGQPGDGDILAMPHVTWPHPVVLWIECKSSDGKQSDDQKLFQSAVEELGHYYLIARSSDDIKEWLKKHGAH